MGTPEYTVLGPIALLGLGRAGAHLALSLRARGAELRGLWDHSPQRAQALVECAGLPVAHGPLPETLFSARVWVLAVPDDQLEPLAKRLDAALRARSRPGRPEVALHLAGALGPEALSALQGVSLGCVHPLKSLTDPLAALGDALPVAAEEPWRDTFQDVPFALEAQQRAEETAEALVQLLGGRALRVRPGEKARYHAAAVLASNALVGLMAEAERLMGESLEAPGAARELVCQLAQGALSALRSRGPVRGLTGPVLRGDEATIARHRELLRGDPAGATYRELSLRLIELAREAGTPDESLETVRRALSS